MTLSKKKNLTILITEIAVVFLMSAGFLPLEAGLFLTGLMIFYFLFSPLKDSLWVFIASIPLFVALPIKESFDSMANWRILLAILFLVLFFKEGISIKIAKGWRIKEKIKHYPVEYLALALLVIASLSLFNAVSLWIGIKKILFLVNIFLLFLIIRNMAARDKTVFRVVLSGIKTAIGITFLVGFIQYLSVIFVRLFPFWQFWAKSVIPVFYGQNLGNLLSYSNTWFSYYSSLPATLRMFSVFPDSHSFAFFCILSLPFFLTKIFLGSKNKIRTALWYFFLVLCLLAIIFSGSRGAWVAGLGSFLVSLAVLFFFRISREKKKQIILIAGALVMFFLLFPISSRILLFYQQVQLDRPIDVGDASFFERARSIFDLNEISVKSRLEIWQKTIVSISERPFLGVGIGNYPVVLNEELSAAKRGSSAHSLYLDVFAEMGLLALLILITLFFFILKDSWRVFIRENGFLPVWSGFFLLALIWILGYSLFDVVLLNDKVLLFFMANLAVLYSHKHAGK